MNELEERVARLEQSLIELQQNYATYLKRFGMLLAACDGMWRILERLTGDKPKEFN